MEDTAKKGGVGSLERDDDDVEWFSRYSAHTCFALGQLTLGLETTCKDGNSFLHQLCTHDVTV